MFKKKKELRWLTLGALFLSVCGLIVAYVSMSTALNIKEVNHVWDVKITNVKVDTTGLATATMPDVNVTSMNNFKVNFTNENEVVTYKFNVKNDGAVDALLKVIGDSKPTCFSYGNSSDCSKIKYELLYEDGSKVSTGDILSSDTHMKMIFKITYTGSANVQLVADDFDLLLLYEQA